MPAEDRPHKVHPTQPGAMETIPPTRAPAGTGTPNHTPATDPLTHTPYHPPRLNLTLVETRIHLPTRKPRVAPRRLTAPIRPPPPPKYTLHAAPPAPYADFITIPLESAAATTAGACSTAAPCARRRRDKVLIAVMLLCAALAFLGALAVCVLLALAQGAQGTEVGEGAAMHVPVMIFVMAAFLVVAGGLVARVVWMWVRMRRGSGGRGVDDGGERGDGGGGMGGKEREGEGEGGGEGEGEGVRVEVVEKWVAPPGYMEGLEGRDPFEGAPGAIGIGMGAREKEGGAVGW